MYKVISFFTDLQDDSYAYHEGDTFPRDGMTVSKGRLAELSGPNNKQGKPLIKEVKRGRKTNANRNLSGTEKLV